MASINLWRDPSDSGIWKSLWSYDPDPPEEMYLVLLGDEGEALTGDDVETLIGEYDNQ